MRVLVAGGNLSGADMRGAEGENLVLTRVESRERVIEEVRAGRVDCVCAPVEFLGANGWRLVSEIREVRVHVPVLALSETRSDLADFGEPDEPDLLGGLDGHLALWRGARWAAARAFHTCARRRSLLTGPRPADIVRILLAGSDDCFDASAVREVFERRRMAPIWARTAVDALRQLRVASTPVALFDEALLCGEGSALVNSALRFRPSLYAMVVARNERSPRTDQALASGARGLLSAPLGRQQLWGAVRGALRDLEADPSGLSAQPKAGRAVLLASSSYLCSISERLVGGRGLDVVAMDPGVLPDVPAAVAAARADALLVSTDGESSPPAMLSKATEGIEGLPVLALCTSPSPAQIKNLIAAGADDVIDSASLAKQHLWGRIVAACYRHAERVRQRSVVADLKSREFSQRSVLSRSADGMLVANAGGLIQFANPAAERMLGAPPGGLLAQGVPFRSSPDRPVELKPSGPGEDPRFAEVSETAIVWEGERARLVTFRDVTERVRADSLREKLLHSERLASIGQLAAGITHEINNPAAYVLANLVSMQEKFGGGRAPSEWTDAELRELRSMLDESVQGMDRIRRISRDLRTFARIESDELERVELNRVVDTACNIAYSEIRYRARLVKQLGRLPIITGSRGKLAQVVTNLLVNAAQAIADGESVDDNQIIISTGCDAREVWVTVQDTGAGIPEAVRARVFQPFFTTKPRGVGTGLGLALCADIARQHGGTLSLYNRSDRGAHAELRLPRKGPLSEVVPRPRPAVIDPESIGRKRILVVDDEPLVLRGYRRMLRQHEVIVAPGGREGLEKVRDEAGLDLIICDLMMPDVDGVAVHEEVSARHPGLARKFAFCSGGALTPRTKAYLEKRKVVVLEKPLTVAAVTELLQRLALLDVEQREVASI